MNIEQLLSDVRATFPIVQIQLRMQYTTDPDGALSWMIAAEEDAVMPDGLSIFKDGSDDDNYRCAVHVAFGSWLEARGWYLERNDEFWFWPTPLPTPEEIAEWHAGQAIASARRGDSIDDGCPF